MEYPNELIMSSVITNAKALEREYAWFSEVIQLRLASYLQPGDEERSIYDLPPPELESGTPYPTFLEKMNKRIGAEFEEAEVSLFKIELAHRMLLLLALAPHLKPEVLDIFFARNMLYDRAFTEFGGVSRKRHGGFLPTGETAMFLLTGGDLVLRLQLQSLFAEDHFFATENVLHLRGQQANEPYLSGLLTLSDEALAHLTSGEVRPASHGSNFPARQLTTEMTWNDLVLAPHLIEEIEEISNWMKHETTIRNKMGLGKFSKPGYRALFYGPTGTGKTLTAALIGQRAERPVYRVDLSQVVSKYIGETEKNLAQLFARAERNNWILFFDEADALFGKRTNVKDSNDRFANQETAYLLQRIEEYHGLVIMTTDLKRNIDEAFARRFQSMLYFPTPDTEQRLLLWQNAFGKGLPLTDDVDLMQIARDYELAGGSIINVVRYCALAAARRKPAEVRMADLMKGIRRELRKEGRTV
jgi:hypothetical protein